MASKLQNILNSSEKDKVPAYTTVLQEIFSSPSPENDAKQFLTHVIQEQVGLPTSRRLVQAWTDQVKDWWLQHRSEETDEMIKRLWQHGVATCESRLVAFEEQVSTIREEYANLLQELEDWKEAAQILQGIPLDSGHRTVSDLYKLQIYVRIAQLLLEEEDSVSAEMYVKRAGLVLPNVEDNVPKDESFRSLQLQFRAAQARVFDFKKEFLDAAQRYHNLSFDPLVGDSDRLEMLRQAMICAMLGAAGPKRIRMLATLYKDERTRDAQLQQGQVYQVFEKMYLGRLIKPEEMLEFREQLKPHHLATIANKGAVKTVLDRAVVEHNLLTASKLYKNISFKQLASLLGVNVDEAEEIAAKMMTEGRMEGRIDQVNDLIHFDDDSTLAPLWDQHISNITQQVDYVASMILAKHPELAV